MKWHYIKDEGYPVLYKDILVKCADGDFLRTNSWHDDFRRNLYSYSYLDDDGFCANIGDLYWDNVVAWCYLDDMYESLQESERHSIQNQ